METAARFIAASQADVAAARARAAELKAGMDIFGIQQPPYKELQMSERVRRGGWEGLGDSSPAFCFVILVM